MLPTCALDLGDATIGLCVMVVGDMSPPTMSDLAAAAIGSK